MKSTAKKSAGELRAFGGGSVGIAIVRGGAISQIDPGVQQPEGILPPSTWGTPIGLRWWIF